MARRFVGTDRGGRSYHTTVRGEITATYLDANGSPLWYMGHNDSDEERVADGEDLNEQELLGATNLQEQLRAKVAREEEEKIEREGRLPNNQTGTAAYQEWHDANHEAPDSSQRPAPGSGTSTRHCRRPDRDHTV